jgi:hypothetical protein
MQKFSPQQVIYVNILEEKCCLTGSSANYSQAQYCINKLCMLKHFQKQRNTKRKICHGFRFRKKSIRFFGGLFLCLAPFVLPLFFHGNFVHRN